MSNTRPKLKIPLEGIDTILEITAVLLLLFIWIYPAIHYTNLPETIPTHFNHKGEANDWGNKLFVWLIPAISTFTFVLIVVLNRFPQLHNYMVNITKENAFKNYQLSNRILRIANIFVLALMALVTFELIDKAQGGTMNIVGIPFLIASLVLPAIGVILAFRYQKKINS